MEKNIIKILLVFLLVFFVKCDNFDELDLKNFKHEVTLPFKVECIVFLSKSDFVEKEANLFFYVRNNSMTLHLNSLDDGEVSHFNDVWNYIKEFDYSMYKTIEFYFVYFDQRVDLHGRLRRLNNVLHDMKFVSLRYKTSIHEYV